MQVQLTIQPCVCVIELLLTSLTLLQPRCSTQTAANLAQERGPNRLKVAVSVKCIRPQQRLLHRFVGRLPIGASIALRAVRCVHIDPVDQRISELVAFEVHQAECNDHPNQRCVSADVAEDQVEGFDDPLGVVLVPALRVNDVELF